MNKNNAFCEYPMTVNVQKKIFPRVIMEAYGI